MYARRSGIGPLQISLLHGMVLDKITFIRSSSLARGTDIVDIVKLAKTEIFGCDLL